MTGPNFTTYALIYAGCYIGLAILVGVIFHLIGFEANAGIGAALTFTAAMPVAQRFFKKEGRVATDGERRKLVLYSTGVVLILNAVIAAIIVQASRYDPEARPIDLPMLGWIGIFLFVGLLTFGVLTYFYKSFFKTIAKQAEKQAEKKTRR